VNESDPKLLDLQSALAEMQRLREENVRLRRLLQEHGIQVPVQSTNEIPVTTSVLPSAHAPALKAEQRIALFRNLFHGREDVYAVRWENADGRSGQGKLIGRLIATTSKQSSRTAHCDASVTHCAPRGREYCHYLWQSSVFYPFAVAESSQLVPASEAR
jgi:hypothetical protein